MTRLQEEYDEVFQGLSRVELQQGGETLEDLDLPDLFGPSGQNRWLGFYTEEGLRYGLEQYGLFDDLARIGYEDVRLELRMDDPDEHLLRFWAEKPRVEREPLIEVVVRRELACFPGELAGHLGTDCLPLLTIDWLQLQSPRAKFTAERPPLPGQRYPGLGLGEEVLQLLRQACKRLSLDGLATVPSYFHNACLYSDEFQYLDPYCQGVYLALRRDVLPRVNGSLAAASWAIKWNMVARELEDGTSSFDWFHGIMVAPISERLTAYCASKDYQRDVQRALSDYTFVVFDEALGENLDARGIDPLDRRRINTWIRR